MSKSWSLINARALEKLLPGKPKETLLRLPRRKKGRMSVPQQTTTGTVYQVCAVEKGLFLHTLFIIQQILSIFFLFPLALCRLRRATHHPWGQFSGPTPGFPSGGSFNSGSFPSPSHTRNDMPPPSLPYGPGGRIGWSIDWLVDWIAFALCGRWIDWLIDWLIDLVCFICCGFCDYYRRPMLLFSVSDYHFNVIITAYGSDLFNFLSR